MNEIIQILRKTNSNLQIVMLPFGGGSGFSYAGLLSEIHKDIEIVVINPPGHLLDPGNPLESIDEMVKLYSAKLTPILKKNCLVFGHSLGGIVTYELCKVLTRTVPIKKIIISSINPPHSFIRTVNLNPGMDNATLVNKCVELGGIPQAFQEEPELIEMFIRGLRGDLVALESYHNHFNGIREKLSIPGVILYGDKDFIVDETGLHQWIDYLDSIEMIRFPGRHFYLFEPVNIKPFGSLLSKHALS